MPGRLDYIQNRELFKSSPIYGYVKECVKKGYSWQTIERAIKKANLRVTFTDDTLKRIVMEDKELLEEIETERAKAVFDELDTKHRIKQNYVKSIEELSKDKDARNFKLVADYLEIGAKPIESEEQEESTEEETTIYINGTDMSDKDRAERMEEDILNANTNSK